MSSCQDLCTAEKCAELEQRIDELQFKLSELEFKLDGHIFDRVTSAHDFDLNITGILQYDFAANSIRLDMWLVDITNELLATPEVQSLPLPFIPEWIFNQHVNDFNQHLQTPIPEAHSYEPVLQVDVFDQPDGSNILKVQLDQVSDEDIFNVEPLELTIDKTSLGDDFNYQFMVSLGGKSAIANQLIAGIGELSTEEVEDFFFTLNDIDNNDYKFEITLGDRTRTQVLNLPSFGGGGGGGGGGTLEIPPTTVAVNGNYDVATNNLNISVTVDGVSATKSINLDEMPFAEILECLSEIKLELEKEPETITIVADPKVRANIKGSCLVVDFTTVDAFPNLNATNSKWRVQIPEPIDDLTWSDLEGIRWNRGSRYGRMRFANRATYNAGWFNNDDAGNSYFAQIAIISKLDVENITFTHSQNSRITPEQQLTRVYRAYKVTIGNDGEIDQTLTEVFRPPLEEEENAV